MQTLLDTDYFTAVTCPPPHPRTASEAPWPSPPKCPFLPPCSPLTTSLRRDASPSTCGPATPPLDMGALTTPLISPLGRSPPKLWFQCSHRGHFQNKDAWAPPRGWCNWSRCCSKLFYDSNTQARWRATSPGHALAPSLRLLSLLFALGLLFHFSSCFYLESYRKTKGT